MSAVVIAAAHNVMWCFTKASSDEYVVAGLTVSEWWRLAVPVRRWQTQIGLQTGSLPLRSVEALCCTDGPDAPAQATGAEDVLPREERWEVKPLSRPLGQCPGPTMAQKKHICMCAPKVCGTAPILFTRTGLASVASDLASPFCLYKDVHTITGFH